MIGWLWRVIFGRFSSCEHKWEHKETHEVFTYDVLHGKRKTGEMFTCCCAKCGAWRSYRT
jgi:hypothetical protein